MYLGHTTIEQLVARIKPEHTLYLNLLEEHFPSPDSIDLLRASLLAQTRVWNGRDHDLFYWKMPVGDVLPLAAHPGRKKSVVSEQRASQRSKESGNSWQRSQTSCALKKAR